ncbi:TPA: hypothetical protein ACUME3_001453 [Haemophilus influenzae]
MGKFLQFFKVLLFIENGNKTIPTKVTCEEQSRKVKNINLKQVENDGMYWICTMNGVYPIRGVKLKQNNCAFITSISAKKGFIYATQEEATYVYDCIMGVRNGK